MKTAIIDPVVITNAVSNYFKLSPEDVIGNRRKKEFVKARHISMYFIDEFSNDSLDKKGNLFGKDHDDIIFARHSVNNQAEIYRNYRKELAMIRQILERKIDIDFDIYKQFDTDKA